MVKLAFMSSTCPEWTIEQMVDAAQRYGYEGVDVRVEWKHNHGLELDSTKERWRAAKQYAADHGIGIACIALSTKFARATDAERDRAVGDVQRYAELAADLGAPVMRVFGGNIPEGHTMADLRPATAAALGRAAEAAAPFGVTPCLETHDQHRDPSDVAWIVEHAGHQNVGVVWHVAHHLGFPRGTWKNQPGVSVDDAYAQIGKWVRHLHSGRGSAEGLNEGDDYLVRAFELLDRDGFNGYAANEWIIKQHAEMDPEESLPRAAALLHRWRGAVL